MARTSRWEADETEPAKERGRSECQSTGTGDDQHRPRPGRKMQESNGNRVRNGSAIPAARREGSCDRQRERSSSVPRNHSAPTPSEPRRSIRFDHKRTAGEVFRCKKGKRTDIKPAEWDKFGYASKPDVLTRPIEYGGNVLPIPRVHRKDITPETFLEDFRKAGRPVIVEGALDDWPAMYRWNLDALEERFRHVPFKVAKDDKGKKMRMKMKYFTDYVRHQQDDSPLYLFETNVDDNGYIRELAKDYEVPDLFPQDWLALVNNEARPPFRWFCVGPKRSGTGVHIDPLGTSAWNAVTHGTKRWVLMEPHETKRRVKGKDLIADHEDDEAIMYFDFILPRIKKQYPEMKIYEGDQKPGDLIFVPGDWWHGVLNLEDTVAVTQNYVGSDNFDLVWSKTRKEREKIAYLWLRNMKKYAPELYERAMEMNRRDNFKMRHERPKGDRLPDADSSSSESSSDSSSDEAEDLDPDGLLGAIPSHSALGSAAFKRQGEAPFPNLVTAAKACFERPGKRRRQKEDPTLA
mmetsp:Transcript_49428/g.106454  ORF Transcript_49428/g.106454 Transcript_49428/m.106454 type:complete len:520 (-) Transcript_49428:534-2093(-)